MKTKTKKQNRTRAIETKPEFRSVSLADLDNTQGGACSHAGCSHNGEQQQPGVNAARPSIFGIPGRRA